ncbi:hypothetical protein HYH03_016440 [Edaphochlamys debaryana]|uniref:Uncharacterized protein n=1 Tax=Edaphochlamys debaryana TaxID=47281 RepID=A0A835XHK6_9CHLO|nr:hypothetical protein HYH03_016440 [Edaphochlamys debaryana]|eukprot:KAG2484787.1 hypothetical protein HYH03_016440 [Edaphochlamys debaryana]
MKVDGRDVDLLLLPDLAPHLPDGYPSEKAWAHAQLRAVMQPVYDNPNNPSAAVYCTWREKATSVAFLALVAAQPFQVKLVTQLLKAWRDILDECCRIMSEGRIGETGITSVVLEVVVLAAHQKLRPRAAADLHDVDSQSIYTVQLFAEALRLLDAAVEEGEVITVDAGEWGPPPPLSPLNYRHCWTELMPNITVDTSLLQALKGHLEHLEHRDWQVLMEHEVRIIHPIDPTYNLAEPRKGKPRPQWAAVAELARHTKGLVLGSGSLKDVFQDSYLQYALARAVGRLQHFEQERYKATHGEELTLERLAEMVLAQVEAELSRLQQQGGPSQ